VRTGHFYAPGFDQLAVEADVHEAVCNELNARGHNVSGLP
jgi:hypothetical protein